MPKAYLANQAINLKRETMPHRTKHILLKHQFRIGITIKQLAVCVWCFNIRPRELNTKSETDLIWSQLRKT